MKIFTSYFSRAQYLPQDVVPISISLWPPKGWAGARMPELAPSKPILTEYKANPDWPRYVARFQSEILSNLDPHAILSRIEQLTGGRDACLLCFERNRTQCHRSLVGEWLRENGADMVGEYKGR